MARIRTIKPEYWSSPDTASADDPWARLLFIAMWNWADDTGRGTANPKELCGFAFPRDDQITADDVRRMLGVIRRAFGVSFYKIGGREYYAIPSWTQHQKIDKRSGAKHPGPEDGTDWDPDPSPGSDQHQRNGSARPADTTPNARRDSGAGTGEQGNRGTGEPPAGHSDKSGTAESRASAREAQPLPDDWQPTDIHRQMARVKGLDPDHEVDQFRAYSAAHGKTYDNPYEAFRYWIGNSYARGNARAQPVAVADDPDRELTDPEVDDILGHESPPTPPQDVTDAGVEACKAWARDNDPPWRQARRERAKAKVNRRTSA